jgi:hypothetical protein
MCFPFSAGRIFPFLLDVYALFVDRNFSPTSAAILSILFVGFARISYRRFIAIRCRFKRPTCIQEPLVIGRRDLVQRYLNEKMVSSR